MNRVKAHFDAVAPTYEEQSTRGLWKWLRAREAAAVARLLGTGMMGDVLELGSGSGYYSRRVFGRGWRSLVCVDFSSEMLERCAVPGCTKVLADVQDYVSERQFDVILCAGVLEFLNQPEAVFANVAKMLRPDGTFIALLPRVGFFGYCYRAFHRWGHGVPIRLFHVAQIQRWAEAAGLGIVRVHPVPLFNLAARFCQWREVP